MRHRSVARIIGAREDVPDLDRASDPVPIEDRQRIRPGGAVAEGGSGGDRRRRCTDHVAHGKGQHRHPGLAKKTPVLELGQVPPHRIEITDRSPGVHELVRAGADRIDGQWLDGGLGERRPSAGDEDHQHSDVVECCRVEQSPSSSNRPFIRCRVRAEDQLDAVRDVFGVIGDRHSINQSVAES